MLYSVWYMCCAVRLGARESRAVMEVAEAIEDAEMPIARRTAAVKGLAGIDPLVGAALVPFLVESLMREGAKAQPDDSEVGRLLQEYYEELENTILRYLGEGGSSETREQVFQLHTADCGGVLRYIRSAVAECREFPEHHEGFSSYQDADLYVKESFILALMVSAAELEPLAMKELVSGESEWKIRQLAKKGELGQVCWNLSMRLECILGENPGDVIKEFPDRWQERPDFVELIMPYLFPKQIDTSEEEAHGIRVDELLQETCSLARFSSFWGGRGSERSEPFWLREEASEPECIRASVILWQNIIWNLAFARNPGITIQRLQWLWNAPNFRKFREGEKRVTTYKFLTRHQNDMIPYNIKLEKEEFANIYICSPWQQRTEFFPDDSPGVERGELSADDASASERKEEWKTEDLFHAFRFFARWEIALKAFCAARLLGRIIQYSVSEMNVHYITLLLNLGDAFSCFGARNTFEILEGRGDAHIRALAWTMPVRTLGFYANKVLDETGMGGRNVRIPTEILLQIENRSPYFGDRKERGSNWQILSVYRFSGLFCAARWALLALRNQSVDFHKAVNPWLEGEPESHAAQLVRYLNTMMAHEDDRTRKPYRLSRDSMELFYAMTEVGQVYQYKLGDPEFLKSESKRIEAYDLILKSNPSPAAWEGLEELTPDRFAGESLVIALTNRLRARLEAEEYQGGSQWFTQWKEQMEDPGRRSWITHLARLVLLRLLKVKAVNGDDTLKTAKACVLKYFAGEGNDSPIYYYKSIADWLIQGDDGAGPYEISKRRGEFAVQLLKRCRETVGNQELHDRWRALYYYFLWGVREEFRCGSQSLAKENIVKHWKSYAVRNWDLRTFMRNPRDWDPIQDRFWAEEQGKLLTVGSRLDTSMRFDQRYMIADQFQRTLQANDQWRVGIIATSSEQKVCFYLGDGTKAVYTPESGKSQSKTGTEYRIGDIYGVQICDGGTVQEIKSLGAFPTQNGYREVPKVFVMASEIRIPTREKNISYTFTNDEEMFLFWSGDIVDFLRRRGTQELRNVQVTYCEYDDGKYGWIPRERDFDELILNRLNQGEEQDGIISLTYLKPLDEEELLFSIAPGENYALRREYFARETWAEIQGALLDGEERSGMRVRLFLTQEEGLPKLALPGDGAFDDVNIRWSQMFDTQKPFQIRQKGPGWVLDCEMPEVRDVLQADVDQQECYRLIPGRHYNVQASEDGWSLEEKRNCRVKVIFLKTSVLDKRMSYEEFQRLVSLEPGMVFKLNYISEKPQKRGYRTAYLKNGMKVFCADESISFQKDWKGDTFGKERFCIVDNVKETSPEGIIPEKMGGIWPKCLKGTEGPVRGVLAEYTANINAETDNIENFMLKVYLDVSGKMQELDVPLHAFWPVPDNIGERIDAVKTVNGWIFKVTKRDIVNVRALWRMQYHEEEDIKVTGGPLGLVALARGVTCAMTQDAGEPLLHAYESRMLHILGEQCGVTLGKGSIQIIWPRFSDSHRFPWAYRTNVVELKIGSCAFVGEARQSDFRDNRAGWNVHAEIHRVYTEGDTEYYDLRRVFTRTRSVKEEEPQNKTAREDWIRQYKEWCLKGDRSAFVSFIGPVENAAQVLLRDLRVPGDPNCEIEQAEFINKVELEADHDPIVRGHERQYLLNDIRVRLKIVDGQWVASVRDAQAWELNGELVDYLGFKSGMYARKTFYFAGRDETGDMIFEWGYGNYFKARNEDIVDTNGGTFAYEFFFGDSVRAITFVLDSEGRRGWKARIRQKDIFHELEGQIWEDSFENIVQLLRVKRDRRTESIKISEVSARSRFISTSGKAANGWQFRDGSHFSLSPESQNRLQEEMGGREEMVVFAHINEEMSGREKRDLYFEYISLDLNAGQWRLLENKFLCLQAYKIQETGDPDSRGKIANDYKICFYLPEELPTKCETPRLVMSVNRRKFSLDESRLRLDALSDLDQYVGCNMLVSLGELSSVEGSRTEGRGSREKRAVGTHYWRGSVTSAPKRSLESLKQWLAGMPSYLVTLARGDRMNRGSQQTDPDRKVYAEIVPGIICDITAECQDPLIMDGTLARLSMENDRLCTRVILFGDAQYFSERKRPVELLIMDDRLNRYSGTAGQDNADGGAGEDKGSHFTVASFPKILLRNRALMDGLIREGLPRVGVVYYNARRDLVVEANQYFEVGYLDIQQEDFAPVLRIEKPEKQLSVGTWDQMTFKDGTVSEIVKDVYGGKWHYHDRYTGLYMENAKAVVRCGLPDGEDFRSIVTFYAQGRRLRYSPRELDIFGMSAREILEHGLPLSDRWYPVAAGREHSMWMEIFPGKVVDLSANYLMAGGMRCNLSGLCMSTFGPGDEILLAEDKINTGGQYGVSLMDFRFSGRNMAENGITVLPVADVLADGLILGGGIYRFPYPVALEKTGMYYKGQAVILDSDNRLDADVQFGRLKCGSVVYVSLERNRMVIPGMEDIQVSPAYESCWTNAGWLYKIIYQKREAAFGLFENCIPMVITQIDTQKRKIFVAYQQRYAPQITEGQSLAVNCIGVLPDQFEGGKVVLRSGNYLFLVEGNRILEGVSPFERREICGRLSENRVGFFMTLTSNGWKNGLSPHMSIESTDIELVCGVDRAKGYIVKCMKDFSLKYLPLRMACRVETDETQKVWDALARHPRRTARIMRGDIVSLVDEYKSEENYQRLRLKLQGGRHERFGGASDGYDERIIPRVLWKEEAGYFYYFSEVYPKGDIILLKSEYRQSCGMDTNPIPVDLIKGDRENVVVVPSGEKRVKIYLSKYFMENMRACYKRDSKTADSRGNIQIAEFMKNMSKRFGVYGESREKALGDKPDYRNISLLKDDIKINERLVYLFFRETGKMANEDKAYYKKQCAFTLSVWLSGAGKFLSGGFRGGQTNIRLDLIPTIAAICILDKGDENSKRLSVHLTRMLGYACGLSIHEEQLIYGWIRKEHFGEQWNKLRCLSLGGETLRSRGGGNKIESNRNYDGLLSPAQYRTMAETAESILRLDSLDKYMRNTIYALLLSVAEYRDYSEFFNQIRYEPYCTVRLAPLGRLLTPACGRKSSYDKLPEDLRKLLTDVLKRNTNRNIELCTGTVIPLEDGEREYWDDKVEKCIALCNEIKYDNYKKMQ